MIFFTNSSSPPSAMISVTPPVFTELGGGRREFLELTPCREQHDRQRLMPNPISSSGANKQGYSGPSVRDAPASFYEVNIQARKRVKKGGQSLTFASSWLAKNGGLHMQKSYTISVSSFRASINSVF